MPNEIDQLWSFILTAEAEDLAAMAPSDLDKIIAYQRQARARAESGVKPKKSEAAIDLGELGLAPPPSEPIKRRKL